jgi:ubiquinol-cytochrome c reductase cytochrome c subunit
MRSPGPRWKLRTRVVAAAIGLAVFGAAGAAIGQPPSGIVHPTPERGKSPRELGSELFAANCVSCHGIDGRGIQAPRPGGAGDITGQGPSLRGVGALAPDFYLRTGRMPISRAGEEPERQRPYFSNREIKGLVTYISSFGKGPRIPHPHPGRGSLPRGQQLFTENCAGCHQVVGEGGFVTGARVPVLRHATARQIAEAVRIGPFVMPRFSHRAISRHQLDDIVAYVKSVRSPDDRGGLGIGHIGPVPEGMVAWLVAAVVLVGVCLIIGERRRRA